MAKTTIAPFSRNDSVRAPSFETKTGFIEIAFEEMLPFMSDEADKELIKDMQYILDGFNVEIIILSDFSRATRKIFRDAIDKAVEAVEAESEEDYNTFENEKQIILWTLNNMAKVIDESGVLDYERVTD